MEPVFIDMNGDKLDHTQWEQDEQVEAMTMTRPPMCILELGGRYGLVSYWANRVLDDPTHHVVVEPDVRVIPALKQNRERNGSQYHILEGVISKKPMKICHRENEWETCVEPCLEEPSVPCYTWDEVEAKYGLKFNALYADIEGGFPEFVKENQDKIRQLMFVMFERDGKDIDYTETEHILMSNGLMPHHTRGLQVVYVRMYN